MKQPLATLSFDALQRRWRMLSREDVEAVRDEDQLIALIAARTAEDSATIKHELAAARQEGALAPLARSQRPGPANVAHLQCKG